jgi:DNA-binding winged helix-turn-helix (wHTH) protein
MIIFSGRGKRFYLDNQAGKLWHGTPGLEPVHLAPKQWNLLRCFAQNPGRLIEKIELQEKIWGAENTNVSEASLSKAISDLRRALGDRASDPVFIEVVHGRGYRFVATVENENSNPTAMPTISEKLEESVPSLRAPLAPSLRSKQFTPRRKRAPGRYICDQMSDSIARKRMGPFPTARPIVFEALESYLTGNPRLPLSGLVEAAVQKAKEQMGESAQPWAAIRAVTEKQLLQAGVALDSDGWPLANAWSSKRLVVHCLAGDWRRRVEGEIILALFEEQDVAGDQLLDVARAVWGSGSGEALSRVQSTLQKLIEADRVQEDDRGIFRVKPSRK